MTATSKKNRRRRAQMRKCKWCALTICWLLLVLFGLCLPRGQGDAPLASPVAAIACSWSLRRHGARRQPSRAAATYSRFSSNLQDDASIETQQDRCELAAKGDGQQIDPIFQFFDKAVSGTKLHRAGLDALLDAAKAGLFNVLYFFSLSRLARESVIGMPILKRLVYVYKIRVISVTEGLDTAREGWEILAQILLMQHERYIKELSENSFGGQKGNVSNGFSNGDYCFGFKGEPVPGSETTRRGRHRKPRKKYVIDPVAATWVKRIFHWFVVDRRSLRWITRELNRLQAPKDHRSSTPKWHHQAVARLLGNVKLIGLWPWGRMKNSRDPDTGLVGQDERPVEESRQWLRRLRQLKIISDKQFLKAQRILAKNAAENAKGRDKDGQFTTERGETVPANPLHLLSCLLVCAACGRRFYVGGAGGRYLFCPGYINGTCKCRTTVRRDLAERLILEEIGARILGNAAWLERVLAATITAWRLLQRTLPDELRDTEAAVADLNSKIRRLLDAIEGEETVEPDVQARIAERRAERDRLEDRLDALRQQSSSQPKEPTLAWVVERIQGLQEVLTSSTPAAALALRDLVGGVIMVEELETEGQKRRHLRGIFRLQINSVLRTGDLRVDTTEVPEPAGEVVTIDFMASNPLDAKAEQVKALWDQGMLGKDIAAALKCSRAQVTKLLKHWANKHGVELPNGHARQMEFKYQANPPLYRQIAEQSHEMLKRGLLISEIATELGCDINTVRKAARHWCQLHGLPWVDGRVRRKDLDHKSRPRLEDDRNEDGPVAPVPQ